MCKIQHSHTVHNFRFTAHTETPTVITNHLSLILYHNFILGHILVIKMFFHLVVITTNFLHFALILSMQRKEQLTDTATA